MMTKGKIAEQIQRRLNGGDVSPDTEYDIREIALLVGQALAQLVKGNFLQNLAFGETSIGSQYLSRYPNQPVFWDDELEKSFIEIPCNYLELPADRGIWQVSPVKVQANAFVPVRNGSETLFSYSPASRLEGRIGFWPESNRIYFTDNLYDIGCEMVLLKLVVPSPEETGLDEPYPIGSDMELPIIERVLQIMGVQQPTDDVNDNSNKV